MTTPEPDTAALRAAYDQAGPEVRRLGFDQALADPVIGHTLRAHARAWRLLQDRRQQQQEKGPHWAEACPGCGSKRLRRVHRLDDEDVLRCRDCGHETTTED